MIGLLIGSVGKLRRIISMSAWHGNVADVILRAETKCGVAVSFAIGERVPKVCLSQCKCGDRNGKRVEI